MTLSMKQTVFVLLLLIAAVALFGVVDLLPKSLEQRADQIIRSCARAPYVPSCYDERIPALMDQGLSLEETFAVTRIVQDKTEGYFYCHILGHKVAEKEVAKDPSQWTSVIARCPSDVCSNGCLHGAAQERFRSESLTPEELAGVVPELLNLCEPANGFSFTELERASCYHALGHLSMFLAGGDVGGALGICNQVAGRDGIDYETTCYEGTFMQIFQPLEPEDIALVRELPVGTQKDAEGFCDGFSGAASAACHRESRPLYGTLDKPAELEHFCSLVPGETNKRDCYMAILFTLAPYFDYDIDKLTTLCTGVPKERTAQCFSNAASRFVESDYRLAEEAVALCGVAEAQGVGERCYHELLYYSTFVFHEGSTGFTALCSALPEPWQTRCFAGEGKELRMFEGPTVSFPRS